MGLELLLVGILVVLLVEHSILWSRSFCWCLGHRSLSLRFPSPHIHPIKLPEKRPSQPTLMFSLHVLQQTCALAQCTHCACYIWVRREGGGGTNKRDGAHKDTIAQSQRQLPSCSWAELSWTRGFTYLWMLDLDTASLTVFLQKVASIKCVYSTKW